MKRSDRDIDTLLRDWDRVASTARPPAADARRTVRTTAALPASMVLVAALAVVAVAIVGRGDRGPAADGSPGPSAGAEPSPSSATVALASTGTAENDAFVLTLTTDGATWTEGQDVHAQAVVEYKGPPTEAQVGSASSPVVFSVLEVGGTRSVEGGSRSECVVRPFLTGEPQSFPWVRSGGYGESDPDADFIASYLDSGSGAPGTFRLPAGTWQLSAAFDGVVGGCGRANPLVATVTIRVDPATAVATPAPPTPAPVATEPPLPTEADLIADPFELSLAVERTDVVEGEDLIAWSTVTWAGSGNRVRVGHGPGVVVFSVREVGGDRYVEGGSDSMCVTTGWSRDEAQAFPWSRSGGWSPDDQTPNDRFVEAYVEDGPDGGLRLPAGTWELTAATDLYAAGCTGDAAHLEVTLRVRVAPATATATPSPGSDEAWDLAPVVRCLHLAPEPCQGAVAIAKGARPAAWDAAELVVVDDTCTPGAVCDRMYPFDTIVLFVPEPGSLVGSVAVGVIGQGGPEEVNPNGEFVPNWVAAVAEEGLNPEPGVVLFPLLTMDPVLPGESRHCRLAMVAGTIVGDDRWGIGFEGDAEPVRVIWPFGWSGRRDADGVSLVDAVGAAVGRVGDDIAGSGGWGDDLLLFCG